MDKRVMLYSKVQGWQGQLLEGVSMQYGQKQELTQSRDKSGRYRMEQGVQKGKWLTLRVPKESLHKNTKIHPGDILLPDSGPAKLTSPSQPYREGWTYFVVQQVEDRLGDGILPHLVLKAC